MDGRREEREERLKRSAERKALSLRRRIIVACVAGGLAITVGLVLFGIVYFYEKPPVLLEVEVPAGEEVVFSGWQGQADQQYRTGSRRQRQYLDEWSVSVRGSVQNRTTEDVIIPSFRVDILSRSGKILGGETYKAVRIQARSGRTFAPRFDVDGTVPARIRITRGEPRR